MIEESKLPKSWEMKRLLEIGKCVTGNTPSKNDPNNYGNYIPFVKPPQLFDNTIVDAPEKLSEKGSRLARILPINSVLVTCIGNLGRTALNKVPVASNQQINAIIPSEKIEGGFLFYQAQSSEFRNQLENLSSATTVAIVNKSKFENIKIVVPPTSEQQKIVTKIEELFSQLENGKQQLLTAQKQLKTYRQSLLKSAFEGKLTNQNLKAGELPKDWEVKKLGEVCDIQTGKHDANHASSKGEFRFYTCAFEFMFCDTKRFNGENLILPGNGANVCEVFYYNGEFDAYQRTYVLNKIKTLPKFLYYHMLCHWKKRNHDKQFGSATNYIRMANFTDYKIAFPPHTEQQKIVAILESKLTICDKIEETIKTSLQKSETLRQSILKKAFEGRLV